MIGVDRSERPIPAGDGCLGSDALAGSCGGDRPADLDLVDAVHALHDGTDVTQELAGDAIFHREQAEPVPLVVGHRSVDPIDGLVPAERVRIEPHMVRVGLDVMKGLGIRHVHRPQSESIREERRWIDAHASSGDGIGLG